jgi:type II restriction/modification system DNA methylase subunit YeeA
MDAGTFIRKWSKSSLSERAAAQSHFNDLCELLGHPTPAELDPGGESFTFEKGATKRDGSDGWADVWKRGFFGWEYKGKNKALDAAYQQLLQYSEALENPPLLVVCDMDCIIVHTHFNATINRKYDIPLTDMGTPRNLEILSAVFFDPEKLRPGTVSATVTTEAARYIAEIATAMRDRGIEPHDVAHFLDRIVFCLFAEDVGLLPDQLFTRLLERTRTDPARFTRRISELFAVMADGGDFGVEEIRHFNGNLFNGEAILELTTDELDYLRMAARLDWSAVDASIFGTLFERGMDPARRAQLGAHYTGREDIETLVEPVVMAPLRREWAEVRQAAENLLATGSKQEMSAGTVPSAYDHDHEENVPTQVNEEPEQFPYRANALPVFGMPVPKARKSKGNGKKARLEADLILHRFLERLARVSVLDPACGSGNFLYVTLQKLKDLEKEVITFSTENDFSAFLPAVGPWQLYGLEINEYAHELAQMTVWIGYLQWTRFNGFQLNDDPLLRRTSNFRCMDAILDLSDPDHGKEPEWPKVDFIVGNPPFLGDKLMRGELGDEYVDRLRALYTGRVPGGADLCCYWFERARTQIENGKCKRAGLLATQGIRGGANREVLKRIKETGDIFFAESDRPWVLNGANVHVSMVAFDEGLEPEKTLDGRPVGEIHVNLTGGEEIHFDLTMAKPLPENAGICYLGVMKAGAFDISEQTTLSFLQSPNPHGRPNSDVLRPRLNAQNILQRSDGGWIIDFGCSMSQEDASFYELPWQHIVEYVKPEREKNRRARLAERWWLHGEARPGMRNSLSGLERFIVTPEVSKHRIFTWLDYVFLADHQTRTFARSDDFFFGVLHSRLHEVWALKLGTRLETRPRYTPTTCFETFPFPRPSEGQEEAIAAAAREMDRLRRAWLYPPEWTCEEVLEFPGAVDGPWARYLHAPDARGIGTVRYPRTVAKDADCAAKLKERTLTNLYNARPAWLAHAHRALDEAVFAAYGWEAGMGDEEVLGKLLELNLEISA